MTNKPRFVFDTNTIVSALLFKNSTPRKAFDKAQETGEILLSLEVVDELNDVLGRKKLNRYLREEERIQFRKISVVTNSTDLFGDYLV